MSTSDGKNSTRNRTATALAVLLAAALVACGSDETTPELPTASYTAAVSECGGFAQSSQTLTERSGDYCAAEKLRWSYDADAATLRLLDERVMLNCCGERSVTVKEQGGVYVIAERDEPEAGGERCRCMCVYDFSVELKQITTGTIKVKLVREVTDSGAGPQELYSGQIDLSAGAGSVVVDDTDAPFCDQP